MSVIYKYSLNELSVNTIRSGTVVNFGRDGGGVMCAWVQHYDHNDDMMKVYVVGTGWEFSELDHCVASVIQSNGLVWHLIEKTVWDDEDGL